MYEFNDIIEHVMNNGEWKDNRTAIKTKAISGITFEHDMEKGFPAVTCKKLAFKTMLTELEGFIGGITDKAWYQERGCKIWNEWANPEVVNDTFENDYKDVVKISDEEYKEEMKQIALNENDLGPIYGWQWRRFNAQHDHKNSTKLSPILAPYDQLATIVNTLKTNPLNRRMVCNAWNPLQISQMALPPCHFSWVVTVCAGKLNLNWKQRSCDLFLGVPFNIASYATLLHLLSLESGIPAGKLNGSLDDAHIYENHMDQCAELISRKPYDHPTIETNNFTGIFDWTADQTKLVNYEHHDAIRAKVAT